MPPQHCSVHSATGHPKAFRHTRNTCVWRHDEYSVSITQDSQLCVPRSSSFPQNRQLLLLLLFPGSQCLLCIAQNSSCIHRHTGHRAQPKQGSQEAAASQRAIEYVAICMPCFSKGTCQNPAAGSKCRSNIWHQPCFPPTTSTCRWYDMLFLNIYCIHLHLHINKTFLPRSEW